LAEIMRRCFADFALYLDQRPATAEPAASLGGMGRAYLAYAEQKPLEYRLMFGTPWPEPAAHPDLIRHAVHAFDTLRGTLRRIHGESPTQRIQADLDAMFIWSTLHGMASIKQADVMQHLELDAAVKDRFQIDLLEKIGIALGHARVDSGAGAEHAK
jgi:hypothetical protein